MYCYKLLNLCLYNFKSMLYQQLKHYISWNIISVFTLQNTQYFIFATILKYGRLKSIDILWVYYIYNVTCCHQYWLNFRNMGYMNILNQENRLHVSIIFYYFISTQYERLKSIIFCDFIMLYYKVISYHQYWLNFRNMGMYEYILNQENLYRRIVYTYLEYSIRYISNKYERLKIFNILWFFYIFKIMSCHQYWLNFINMGMCEYIPNQEKSFTHI